MGATMEKNTISYGQGSREEVEQLSRTLHVSVESIEELKGRYLMYRSHNGMLNLHNYIIFFKEYINVYATDLEILKSFNAFDADRDGYLKFTDLLTAITW
jgi:Ca2+-binding EF-hand superfamily protein